MQDTRTFRPIHTERVVTRPRAATREVSAVSSSAYIRLAARIFRRTRAQIITYMIAYFLIPAIIPSAAYTVLLTIVFPVFCFSLSGLYGMRYGFISHYLAIPIILFIPSALAYFAKFSFLYSICYLLISTIALTVGALVKQMSK